MIFHEIFGVYYRTVAKILSACIEKPLNRRQTEKIIEENAFSESVLAIMPALKEQKWQLLDSDNSSNIKHIPSTPVTDIEKRWLKSVSMDKRIKLFGVDFPDLKDVQPLFVPEDIYVFDSYGDGDNYTDEKYIQNFRLIMQAVKENFPLQISSVNRKGNIYTAVVMPRRLEYSEKDDKFRLICHSRKDYTVINLGRIISCEKYGGEFTSATWQKSRKSHVTLEIKDHRNAMERVLLHFAHLERQAVQTGPDTYLLTVYYDRDDETEMLIRTLSFGPFVKAVRPQRFVDLIISRLKRQKIRDNIHNNHRNT